MSPYKIKNFQNLEEYLTQQNSRDNLPVPKIVVCDSIDSEENKSTEIEKEKPDMSMSPRKRNRKLDSVLEKARTNQNNANRMFFMFAVVYISLLAASGGVIFLLMSGILSVWELLVINLSATIICVMLYLVWLNISSARKHFADQQRVRSRYRQVTYDLQTNLIEGHFELVEDLAKKYDFDYQDLLDYLNKFVEKNPHFYTGEASNAGYGSAYIKRVRV